VDFRDDTDDLIVPTQIEHSIDEIWADGRLEQSYNFLDYHFEQAGAYLRARAYLHRIQRVTLYGPFERRGSLMGVVAPEFKAAAVAYLSRRFQEVKHR